MILMIFASLTQRDLRDTDRNGTGNMFLSLKHEICPEENFEKSSYRLVETHFCTFELSQLRTAAVMAMALACRELLFDVC